MDDARQRRGLGLDVAEGEDLVGFERDAVEERVGFFGGEDVVVIDLEGLDDGVAVNRRDADALDVDDAVFGLQVASQVHFVGHGDHVARGFGAGGEEDLVGGHVDVVGGDGVFENGLVAADRQVETVALRDGALEDDGVVRRGDQRAIANDITREDEVVLRGGGL